MTKLTKEQIEQINNIFKTLIEAAEHLHSKVKENEVTQSLYAFSSVIEGYSAVAGAVELFEDKIMNKDKLQVDRLLEMIATSFEEGNLLKVNEIMQFSFLPTLKKLANQMNGYTEEKEEVFIGMFHSFVNLKDALPEPRLRAMLEESEKQQTKLLFFTSEDVDFATRQVQAYFFENDIWKHSTFPFPHVIHNSGAGKQSHVGRKLRRYIPFTNFHVGNKYTLPKRMLDHKKYAELLVPFIVCMNEEGIHSFLEENNKVVFKALGSNRGEDIYFVTKKGQRYAIEEHKKEQIMAKVEFDQWLKNIILAEKGSYIIQKFILTRTKADEPYHFRAHVQKDGKGEWGLTHIYPRVGHKSSHLSNVVTDGRIEDFHEFMMREFDENGPKYEEDILKLSLEIAHYLDKLYGFAISELGLDFAIDDKGRYWMHEANNGPQTAYHEEKRAVHAIGYAKYIAENGIFYDDVVRKYSNITFRVKNSKIPHYESEGKNMLGILVNNLAENKAVQGIAEAAEAQGIATLVFKPMEIDYDYELIKAHVYQNGKWLEQITEYPHLLFDFSQIRNVQESEWIYEELADIPFINEWGTERLRKNEVFLELSSIAKIQSALPGFKLIESTRDVTRELEKYEKVIIERNDWNGKGRIEIKNLQNSQYELTKGNHTGQQNQLQLLNNLKGNLRKNTYVVQEDTRSQSFSLHTDIIFTGTTWKIAGQSIVEGLNETTEAETYLQSIYGEELSRQLIKESKDLAKEFACHLREKYGKMMTVLSVEMAINEKLELKVIGLDTNKVTNIHGIEAYAKGVIDTVKSMLE